MTDRVIPDHNLISRDVLTNKRIHAEEGEFSCSLTKSELRISASIYDDVKIRQGVYL